MDPDKVLADMRAALSTLRSVEEWEDEWEDIVTIIEGFEALDRWLSRGGFRPKGWQR